MSTRAKPWILGISSGFHNGAACLCHGTEIVVAIQEERLSRVKRGALARKTVPRCIQYCLDAAGKSIETIDLIVECKIEPLEAEKRRGNWAQNVFSAHLPEMIQIPHHFGHAVSAFGTSGFTEAAILVIDGGGSPGRDLPQSERNVSINFGEDHGEHISIYKAENGSVLPVEKHLSDPSYISTFDKQYMMPFRSLGLMFSSVSLQIFGQFLEAGKVMALAPLGRPTIPIDDFFDWNGRQFLFKDTVCRRFPDRLRWPNHAAEYQDLAASVQAALEHALEILDKHTAEIAPSRNLCYAGGVALNSVANHRVLRRGRFENIHILPAADDAGTAVGAALHGAMLLTGRHSSRLRSDSMGRRYTNGEIDEEIDRWPGIVSVDCDDTIAKCVDLLCGGMIVGWFQGGSEFGPRSLGYRSILCDPRRSDAKQILNERVKHRESFRPFAPAILTSRASEWFSVEEPTNLMDFMLEVCTFRDSSTLPAVPAVTHVDGTGRLQTVNHDSNPRFYQLIKTFFSRTGVPIILNTSMNIMGEPIVETPKHAIWLLLFTGIDYCILEDRVITKSPTFRSVLDFVPCRTDIGSLFIEALDKPQASPLEDRLTRLLQSNESLIATLGAVDAQRSFRSIFSDTGANMEEGTQAEIARKLFSHSLITFKK